MSTKTLKNTENADPCTGFMYTVMCFVSCAGICCTEEQTPEDTLDDILEPLEVPEPVTCQNGTQKCGLLAHILENEIPQDLSPEQRNLLFIPVQQVSSNAPSSITEGDQQAFRVPQRVSQRTGLSTKVQPLNSIIQNTSGGSSPGLSAHAVAIPLADGSAAVKLQIVMNSSEARYDVQNYLPKILSIQTTDMDYVGSFGVSIVPGESIRPARVYQYFNALTNQQIKTSGTATFENKNTQQVLSVAIDENGTVSSPALNDGLWVVKEQVEGYDCSFQKIMAFEGHVQDCQKIFVNPTGTLEQDQLRVVLSWGAAPRDLDLHCASSDGGHIYFSRKTRGEMNLDVDVTTGFGPETVTVDVRKGIKYCFYVHHYSSDSELSKSGAIIRVHGLSTSFPESERCIEIQPGAAICYPAGKGFWEVFKINENGTTNVLNRICQGDDFQVPRTF